MVVAIANDEIIPAAIINQRLNVEFNLLKINLLMSVSYCYILKHT